MNHHRIHDILRISRAVEHFHLQLIGGILAQEIRAGLRVLSLGLDQREVDPKQSILRLPGLAVHDANMRGRIHGSPREVLTNLLLLSKREAERGIRHIHHIVASTMPSEIAGLALNPNRRATEAICGKHLLDILRSSHHNTKTIRERKGCVLSLNRGSSGEAVDCLDDAVSYILGLDLPSQHFTLEFGIGILDKGCKVFKVPPFARREKRFHLALINSSDYVYSFSTVGIVISMNLSTSS